MCVFGGVSNNSGVVAEPAYLVDEIGRGDVGAGAVAFAAVGNLSL